MTRKKFKLTIQYDGSDFHGWQIQPKVRTVQGDLEDALGMIYPNEQIKLIGSGRTDAGVHAQGQIAHVQLPRRLTSKELCQALNGNIKSDLRIDTVEEVNDDFHARFSAVSREYKYRITKNYSTITRNYTTFLKWDIEPLILDECANKLFGEHDFTSFCKATAEVENKICIIYEACWENTRKLITFRIRANRFLQHMVRYLVGTMIDVARGRYNVEDFSNLLEGNDTDAVIVQAPAKGLILKKIMYD